MQKRASVGLALALGWTAVLPLAWPAPSVAQIGVIVAVGLPPPPLPVYIQPPIPAYGYLWAPGYWAWNGYDYFWVPGAWVLPPEPGLLWTPGYWGWNGGAYAYNPGYWGPTVGFYGGVNYGYGYFGDGFAGGYWRGGSLFYNSAVTNVNNVNITNVYVNNVTVNRNLANISYNGGQGGLTAQPTAAERAMLNQPHVAPTAAQTQHLDAARADRSLTASANHGVPPIAATPTAGNFRGPGVTRAEAHNGLPGAGQNALSPSVALPHGVSNAHALPVPPHPAAAGALPASIPRGLSNDHALPVPSHPAAAGAFPAPVPHGATIDHAMQAPPRPGPSVDRALPTSSYPGAVRNNALAAPHPMAPAFPPGGMPAAARVGAAPPPPFARGMLPGGMPLAPHVGAAPPPPRAMPPGPQAAGLPQGPRPAMGRPPAPPAPHPAEAPRAPHP